MRICAILSTFVWMVIINLPFFCMIVIILVSALCISCRGLFALCLNVSSCFQGERCNKLKRAPSWRKKFRTKEYPGGRGKDGALVLSLNDECAETGRLSRGSTPSPSPEPAGDWSWTSES